MSTELFEMVNRNHEMVVRRKMKARYLPDDKDNIYKDLLLLFTPIVAALIIGFVEAL